MKLRKMTFVVLALLMLILTCCGSPSELSDEVPEETVKETSTEQYTEQTDEPSAETEAKQEELQLDKNYSILFIGNSYTYYNDMPTAIFRMITKDMGYRVNVTAITKGSHKLSQFADPTDEYGAKVEKALKGTTKYDYVIIQEQSIRPATENAPDFYGAVRNLSERIKATGATPVLYATWGRKSGSSTLNEYGWTNESMTWKLAAAYQAIGDELGIRVVHVGLAFHDIYTNKSDIELYNSDKTHPSYAGSYLAATSLFAGIFRVDPTKIDYRGGLSPDEADALCEAARKTVFETLPIPLEYQTTSKGIG